MPSVLTSGNLMAIPKTKDVSKLKSFIASLEEEIIEIGNSIKLLDDKMGEFHYSPNSGDIALANELVQDRVRKHQLIDDVSLEIAKIELKQRELRKKNDAARINKQS